MATTRDHIPTSVREQVLIEAGFRCAAPTCRTILALDLHHMELVSEGGGNNAANLLALCPTCHALFHRGKITRGAIYAWKAILVSLNHAFDREAIDNLLFLNSLPQYGPPVHYSISLSGDSQPEVAYGHLLISGDGVLRFSNLIAIGLASFKLVM